METPEPLGLSQRKAAASSESPHCRTLNDEAASNTLRHAAQSPLTQVFHFCLLPFYFCLRRPPIT
jgi:hypothetical protein